MNQLALLPPSVPAPAGADPAATLPTAGPAPVVIGLDLSLSCTGIAGTGWSANVRGGNRRGEDRLDHILTRLRTYYRNAELVVIEGESFNSKHRHDELISLFWLVRLDLWKRQIPFAIVKPSTRVIYALGNGQPRDKQTGARLTGRPLKAAIAAAATGWFGVEFEGPGKYDEADALVLAALGLHHLGHPQAALPDTHTRALTSVNWPERTDT